jgi:hypothetical protein
VDQPPHELPRLALDDRLLPWREDDGTFVLAAGAMLGKQLVPRLGHRRNADAAIALTSPQARSAPRHREQHRRATLVDDRLVSPVERDDELP